MAYLYFDDNSPESTDYDSNYIYFDVNDPESINKALRQVRAYLYHQKMDCSAKKKLSKTLTTLSQILSLAMNRIESRKI